MRRDARMETAAKSAAYTKCCLGSLQIGPTLKLAPISNEWPILAIAFHAEYDGECLAPEAAARLNFVSLQAHN
jgi:hypothetical protein